MSERDDPKRGSFGPLLVELRKHADMTQEELAAAADVSVATISKLERGDRGASPSMRAQLARALNVPVERLDELEEHVATSRPSRRDGATPSEEGGDCIAADSPLPPDIEQRVREAGHLHGSRSHDPPRVAALPLGEVWWIPPSAVAQDEAGFWVNPLAPASPSGDDRVSPRLKRYPDGGIVLDLSRLPRGARDWGTRARDQYWIRAQVLGDDPSPPPPPVVDASLLRAYRETAIELSLDDTAYVVEPAPLGETEGPFPDGVERILVITAWNPRSRLLTALENQERNRMLAAQLEKRGYRFVEGVGRSLFSDWQEESFAVIDADLDEVLGLAAEYEQNAIYEWTPEHRATIWTDSQQETERTGWQVMSEEN